MKRTMISSTLLLLTAVSGCASSDGKREPETVGDPQTPGEGPRQAEYNPNAPEPNPNAPINESESPEPTDPGPSPGPSPTSSGGPGPGGPPIQCSSMCEGFTGECASDCSQVCAPFDGLQTPCRGELEDLIDCALGVCAAGGAVENECADEISDLGSCMEGLQQ